MGNGEQADKAAKVLFVCEEHVDLAIDIIVDEYEKAPEVLTLTQAGYGTDQTKRCARCEREARYQVS